MKKLLAVLTAVTIIFAFAAEYGKSESIVVCSPMEQFRVDALQEQINQRFPEKNIIVTYMSTGKTAAKIYSEGENTDMDMVIALESGYLNKVVERLADISGISKVPYLKEFAPAENFNKWVTWEKFAGAIIVNRQVLAKYQLEAPKSYADLLKSEYKNLIAMPDPKSSGTGYFFYKSWVNTLGEEAALAYVDALYDNLKQFTESGSGPIKLLRQGEIAIGLGMTFQAMSEINNGQPFEIIFPSSGSPYSLTGSALIKGREERRDVIEVFDFIVNEFFYYDKENFSPETIYVDQINKIPNYPQNIVYADMTGVQDDREKERLLAVWKY